MDEGIFFSFLNVILSIGYASVVDRIHKSKVWVSGLWLSAIPALGLEKTDMAGIERLALTSPTFLLQGFLTGMCIAWLAVALLVSGDIWRKRTAFSIYCIVFSCFLATSLSIVANDVGAMTSWLRLVQTFVVISLVGTCSASLAYSMGPERVGVLLLEIIRGCFYLVCVALVAFLVLSPEMVFFSGEGERGPRLGGGVIHPNTLSLFAVVFLCALDFKQGPRNPWVRIAAYALPISVIFLTDSSGGLLLLSLWLVLNALERFRAARIFFLLGFWSFFVASIVFFLAFLSFSVSFSSVVDTLPATWVDRLFVYQAAIDGIKANPCFGVGAYGGARAHFSQEFADSYFLPSHAHNYIFDAFLSRGLIGGGVFMLLGIFGIHMSMRSIYRGRRRGGMRYTFAMIFLFVFINGLMESSVSGALKPIAHFGLFASLFFLMLSAGPKAGQAKQKLAVGPTPAYRPVMRI